MEEEKELELRVQIPEGYEIDEKNSTFECIKLKKKPLSYLDILTSYDKHYIDIPTPNSKFTAKIIAISKLMFVAKYLNDGWVPDFKNANEKKHYIYVNNGNACLDLCIYYDSRPVYFKTKELAQQAIKILGEETIKEALSNDY